MRETIFKNEQNTDLFIPWVIVIGYGFFFHLYKTKEKNNNLLWVNKLLVCDSGKQQ